MLSYALCDTITSFLTEVQMENTEKKSSKVDMINGALAPKIFKYTIPLAFTAILQQLFNAADVAVVGRFVGKEAMAAVGSNAAVVGLMVNLFLGISLGANVVIAHASGQKNDERISKAVHTSVLLALLGGVVMMILGEIIAKPLVEMLGVPLEVMDMSINYLRIYLVGMPVIFLYNFESAIFRSRGNSKLPLTALIISGIINVILNLVFVIVFGMDVDGVAWATVISNFISSGILFICLLRTEDKVRIDFRKFGIDLEVLVKILKIGVPSGVQGMVFSLSNIVVQSAINSLGATVMAASSAAFYCEVIAYNVMNAYGQACTTFVGQNYGAGQNERCRNVLKTTLLLSFFSTAFVCVLILLMGHQVLGLFNKEPEVISTGMIRLKFIFFAYIFSFAQECFTGYLRGFGISAVPAAATLIGVCGMRVFWIFTVFKKYPSFSTIMMVYPISLGLVAILILLMAAIIKPSRKFAGRTEL